MGEAIVLILLIPILFLVAFLATCIGDVPGGKKDAADLDNGFWMPLLIIAF